MWNIPNIPHFHTKYLYFTNGMKEWKHDAEECEYY